MKIKNHISRFLFALLVAGAGSAMLFTSCREYDENMIKADQVELTLYLQTSGAKQTRAYEGKVGEQTGEDVIHSVKVWAFDNTTEAFLGYTDVIQTGNKVTLSIPQTFVNSGHPADLYIIANPASVGITADGSTRTEEALEDLIIGGNSFTPAAKTAAVPDAGLPMSRIVKGLEIEKDDAGKVKEILEPIEITRAVSKIHFAFGMYDGEFGEIVGITFNGGQIAKSEYIFPVDPSVAANAADYTDSYLGDLRSNIVAESYEADAITYGSADGTTLAVAKADMPVTATDDNPADYAWGNWIATEEHNALTAQQKAEQYYADITTKPSTTKPFVTHTLYLRESDKKLTGTIYYRYKMSDNTTTPIKSLTFEMDAESEVQDFARNHVWIVYAYFEGGELYVNPTIADWIDAPVLNYTLKMNTNMRLFDSWLYRYDTVDQDYSNWTNWAGSHMAVSEGRVTTATETEPVAGRPLRSPQIQLITTGVADASVAGSGTFELTVDNDDFEIIRANKNDVGVVTSYDASTNGTLTIPAGDDVYTYFYVVPKEGVTPSDPVAHVFLYYNDPVLGKVKVTYNYSSLPGYSDDSSEIWVYYVPSGQYNNNLLDPDDPNSRPYLKMYYQDYNNPLVPTPVQS